MKRKLHWAARQRGMALVSAMLLLVIITILALSMFRSVGTQEKVAGNVREKERALHAAESAQQYGEWVLLNQPNLAAVDVTCGGNAPLQNAMAGEVEICANSLAQLGFTTPASLNSVPWTVAGGQVGSWMLPQGMTTSTSGGWSALVLNGVTTNTADFYAAPVFYIADVGSAADGQGEAYQIDAYGYGGSANAVAVVESVYEVAQIVTNHGGL